MWKTKRLFLILGDIILLYTALAGVLLIRYSPSEFWFRFEAHLFPFSALFILWFFVFYLGDLYRPTTFSTRKRMLRALARALTVSGILSIVLLYLLPNFFQLTPKTNLILTGVLFFVLGGIFRLVFLQAFSLGALKAHFLGASAMREKIESYLRSNPHIGYAIDTWIEKPTDSDLQTLKEAGMRHESIIIVVSPDIMKDSAMAKKIYTLLSYDLKIVNAIDFYEEIFEKIPLELIEPNWFVEHIITRRPLYDALKRAVDIFSALILIVLLLPLGILIALSIFLFSRGSIFYTQNRMGKNGKKFLLYKFRTMVANAETIGPAWTEKNDPRITSIGRFLRSTHLDEISQLFNILKGDISFTGPRPESTELTEKYSELPYYAMRHAVTPGMTGWAQINYRPSASLEEAYEKLRYDIFYVKNRSFFLDTLIMLRTVKHFFFSHE